MIALSILDVFWGSLGIAGGIYTIIVISKNCDRKDKKFFQVAGAFCIFFGIWIIVYPFLINWLRR